ncbi:Dopey, N-terminal-domain-containing protein [Entophlyctis helioformis]|nr:Dopey, N-terminal-domain-containing protein [Entophlyctis helioformis]
MEEARASVAGADYEDLRKDPEFKKFSTAIDRALQSFDSVSEWADVIGFLTRLAKIFQLHPQFTIVPKKLVLSKRLAQCLNPALPAGVHTKALEVYSLIFQAAGKTQLAEDLPLWSFGLFPFSAHAAMSVKPSLLSLYEKHYLPLGIRLRPSIKGFVLAILPVLDEEGNDFFEKALSILDATSHAVEHPFFFHALWLAICSSPHQRQACVHYLLRRLPRLNGPEDKASLIGNHPELLARAITSLLTDKAALVQRGALELLVTQFPLSSTLFNERDLNMVISGAMGVLLRRDMSLNRRLYAWILGSGTALSAGDQPAANIASVTLAIKLMFDAPHDPSLPASDLARPYKILISLLDKPELGPVIVDAVFIGILRSLKLKCTQSPQLMSELLPVATMLFDNLDAFFIWKQLHLLLVRSHSGGPSQDADAAAAGDVDLVLFTLEHFKFADDETQRIHLPFVYQTVASQLSDVAQGTVVHPSELRRSRLLLCSKVVDTILPSVFANTWCLRDFRGTSNEQHQNITSASGSLPALTPLYAFGGQPRATSANVTSPMVSPNPTHINVMSPQGSLANILSPSQSAPNLDTSASHACSTIQDITNVYRLADTSSARRREWLDSVAVGRPSLEYALIDMCAFSCSVALGISQAAQAAAHPVDPHSNSSQAQSSPSTKTSYRDLSLHAPHSDHVALFPGHHALSTSLTLDEQYCLDLWRSISHIVARHVRAGSSLAAFGKDWFDLYVSCCTKVRDFEIVQLGLSSLFLVLSSPGVPHILLQQCNRSFATLVTHKLWMLLSPENLLFHSESVQLLRQLMSIVGVRAVEECITSLMLSGSDQDRGEAFHNFGVFWRHFEDSMVDTSILFARPLFVVFDALRSQNLILQLAGQNWLRSYVRSYVRIVLPLFAVLVHPDIGFETSKTRMEAERVSILRFTGKFNQAQVEHALGILNQLLDFGNQLFLRSMWSSFAQQPWIQQACKWAQEEHDVPVSSNTSFAEALIIISLRFVSAEYIDVQHPDPVELQVQLAIQQSACRFLQSTIARSSAIPEPISLLIHDVIIHKLHHCVLDHRLELQQHLLPLLNLVASHVHQLRRFGDVHQVSEVPEGGPPLHKQPLLIHTILKAISLKSNRAMLQHWIDLLFMYLPRLRPFFRAILLPIMLALCHELRDCQATLTRLTSFRQVHGQARSAIHTPMMNAQSARGSARQSTITPASGHPSPSHNTAAAAALALAGLHATPEIDILVILHGLERTISYCLQEDRSAAAVSESARGSTTEAVGSIVSLSSIIGSALVGEPLPDPSDKPDYAIKTEIFALLPGIFAILRSLCATTGLSKSEKQSAAATTHFSIESISERVHYRVRRLLEAVYRLHPSHTIEALVEVWFAENEGLLDSDRAIQHTTSAMIDLIPGCTPRIAIGTLLDSLKQRLPYLQSLASRDKSIKGQRPIPDTAIVLFIEHYVRHDINAATAVECWPAVLSFMREVCVQATNVKYLFFPLLRLLYALIQTLNSSQALDDKRIRKDAEEMMQRLCDYCILIGGRAFDQGAWRRVLTGDVPDSIFRDDRADGSAPAAFVSPARKPSRTSEDMMIQEIIGYFADTIVPSLRQLMQDQDRAVALSTNFIYYIAGPMLKSRHSMNKSFLNPILRAIVALTSLPSAIKPFRKDIWDAFLDPRFFQMGARSSKMWQAIMHSVVSAEKERLAADLLARVSATASTTIFVSRDQEIVTRAQMLRRVAFVLFAAPSDFHLQQLPAIQEKIVECLKSGSGLLQLEAFFCLRIIFCRISAKHLSNFWPIVLSELIRIFLMFIRDASSDRTEDLALLLAGCKLLDLLLTLGIEEFQWHQWLFVTETADFYEQVAAKSARPVALVDKLSQRWTAVLGMDAPGLQDGQVAASNDLDSQHVPALTLTPANGASEQDFDRRGNSLGITLNVSESPSQRPSTVYQPPPPPQHVQSLRRPMITKRSIQSRQEVFPFVRQASRMVHSGALQSGWPDLELLDRLLELEFLDIESVKMSSAVGNSTSTGGIPMTTSLSAPGGSGMVGIVAGGSGASSAANSPARHKLANQ